ncbi:MAG: branched-chain amino acid ABC transporter permease [Anaerolineae bacterium]|nr:MAG: branched-chain amino acid ABC transporter permease [Anaerolineae bacterium]
MRASIRDLLKTRIGKLVTTLIIVLAVLVLVIYLGSAKNLQPPQYVQLILDGLRGGAIYALIALGFVTVFNVTGVINFAQGGFVMLGAMLCVSFNDLAALSTLPPAPRLVLSALLSVVVSGLIGAAMERLTIYPARHSPPLTWIIITVGVYTVMWGAALLIWGADPYQLPAFTTLEQQDQILRFGQIAMGTRSSWIWGASILPEDARFFGIMIKAQSLWIWGTTVVILAALATFFERTVLGKAVRACAVNRRAAQLMGISPSRMSLLAFTLAAALGAIGGIVLAPATTPIYDMGLKLGLKGFVAAIMGGLVSSSGAVVGGLLLGILENLGAGVTKAGLKDIFAFIALILILLFRPHGIIGGEAAGVEED